MRKVAIIEVRKLLLPIETVVDAILELDYQHRGTLCRYQLQEACIEEGEDPGLLLVLKHRTDDATETVERRLTLSAVAAAVIHYCVRSQIPLPRHSTKSITIVPEGFQLTLRTRTEVPELHSSVSATWHAEPESVPQAASDSPQPPVEPTGNEALDNPNDSEPEEVSDVNVA